jgi:hypothetical protein
LWSWRAIDLALVEIARLAGQIRSGWILSLGDCREYPNAEICDLEDVICEKLMMEEQRLEQ